MGIVTCSYDRHAEPILAILNEAIVNSTAIYDYEPRPMSSMRAWFDNKERAGFPIVGLESDSGDLLGFATYGPFRAFPAYKYTVEHSVYVDHRYRGEGHGRLLLQELIGAARTQDMHVMIGAIDGSNETSIALHRKLGFVSCGIIKDAGFKFGRWLDLALYQLILDTPQEPTDG
jgi:L-amino acid N-acyltransferase YncA